jgi:hypothetical protein
MANSPPVRYTSGISTDQKFGPLGDYGLPNPFFYHSWADDFDQEVNETGAYTKTTTGNGTVALVAGDGGLGLFTTNSSTPAGADIASLQLPVAGFTYTAGKRLFFLTRFQASSISAAAFQFGLIQQTVTPGTVTDGIWFSKAAGSLTNLAINIAKASAAVSVALPTAAYTLANNVNVDLAFSVDRNGDVLAWVGSQLVGYIPQSGTGPNLPPLNQGFSVRILSPAFANIPIVNLTPTLAMQSGAAASSTMTVDFVLAAKER